MQLCKRMRQKIWGIVKFKRSKVCPEGLSRYHSVRETWGQGQRGCVSALKSSGQKHSKSSWLWQEKPGRERGLQERAGDAFSPCAFYFLWMFEVWQWVSMTQAINKYSKFKLRENKKGRKRDFPSDLVVMNLPCSGRNTSSIPSGGTKICLWASKSMCWSDPHVGEGGGTYGFLIDFRLTPLERSNDAVRPEGHSPSQCLSKSSFGAISGFVSGFRNVWTAAGQVSKVPKRSQWPLKTPQKPPSRTLCISAWDWKHHPAGLSSGSAKFLALWVPDFALVFTSVKWITRLHPVAKDHLGEIVAWSCPTASI